MEKNMEAANKCVGLTFKGVVFRVQYEGSCVESRGLGALKGSARAVAGIGLVMMDMFLVTLTDVMISINTDLHFLHALL